MDPVCRICFESSSPLIRPCSCSGTSAFIHRECLDRWRSSSNDPAAYHRCSTCGFHYRHDLSHTRDETILRVRFTCWLILDIIVMFILWQTIVIALAAIFRFGGLTPYEDFPFDYSSKLIADYASGMLTFFFLLGIVGFFTVIGRGGSIGGSNCGTGPCLVLFAVIGVIYGIYLAFVLISNRVQARTEYIYRHESAIQDQVLDLKDFPQEDWGDLPLMPCRRLLFFH